MIALPRRVFERSGNVLGFEQRVIREDFFAAGAGLFVRPISRQAILRPGAKVLVRDRSPGGATIEILAGTIGYSNVGDLVAATHSLSRDVPSAILIRAGDGRGGLAWPSDRRGSRRPTRRFVTSRRLTISPRSLE
jgi:hypothetical protein